MILPKYFKFFNQPEPVRITGNLSNRIKMAIHFYLIIFLVSKMFRIFVIKSEMFL